MQLRTFDVLKSQILPARTPAKSALLCFKSLGLRLTKINYSQNMRGVDIILPMRNVQVIPAIQFAIKEDSIAYW